MMHGILTRDVMLGVWISLSSVLRAGDVSSPMTHAYFAEEAADASDPGLIADDETFETLYRLIAILKAHRAAWAEFCEGLQIGPEQGHFAYHTESAEIAENFEEVSLDETSQADLVRALRAAWAHRTQEAPQATPARTPREAR